jgi:DNA-directed RNA polymerase II subunit RPB2
MNAEIAWNVIDKFFEDNPNILVKHHLASYNDFISNGIKRIFKEKNPIVFQKDQNLETNIFNLRSEIFIGGKSGDRIYYGKPVIFDEENNGLEKRSHFMYPNEARLRNMTYSTTIHYDIEIDYIMRDSANNIVRNTITLEKIFLGRFPIMLQSELCILNGLNPSIRFNMGECRNDYGGYFIIDGKEKFIISQEKFADNMLYIREYKDEDEMYSHSADIRTVSEDASKPERTMSVRIIAPGAKYSNGQIVVLIPNVRKPMPLFIVMRALGVLSDKDIIEFCILDLEKNKDMIDLFIPSIHDANKIFTQEIALKFIATFTKSKTVSHTHDILMNYFMPQIGELNYINKAYFLGYIVYKLLLVYTKIDKPTDRDNFKFKRVDSPGRLLYDLFKEYYSMQQLNISLAMDREYNMNVSRYNTVDSFPSLISLNELDIFKDRVVESGFKRAFKGDWGSVEHNKKIGVVQDVNRLSYNSFISGLRKINLPMDSSSKSIKPRLLHGSQWGIIDPVDTPDGANCGLHKNMTLTCHITTGISGQPLTKWLRDVLEMKLIEECPRKYLFNSTKVFVNGAWVGVVSDPKHVVSGVKVYRRYGLISPFISVNWDIQTNEIFIFTDGGRLCRPLFYYDEIRDEYSFNIKEVFSMLQSGQFNWHNIIGCTETKIIKTYKPESNIIYTPRELYGVDSVVTVQSKNIPDIIEYIDTSEAESTLITLSYLARDKPYTHVEIHPSLMYGFMGNQIVYPENNPLPRNAFACGQAKQAVSLYSTNFFSRIDKMGVMLNYGQIPLVKSRYLKYINNEEHPCGENVIVAIMCYSGYNVEDSILFNEGSVKRGMFRTTYFNSYETREETIKGADAIVESHIVNIENESNVVGLKPGYEYDHLDIYGMIKENTELNDKIVLIGKVKTSSIDPNKSIDESVFPKKGQLGFVDKTFITESEEGTRLAKVRIREERMPSIGDKFASRAGQKGTVGVLIREQDMPFTADGIRPDIIINPHAIPSRMTIGQLVETLTGKACTLYGAFGDCTAFLNTGPKEKVFGRLLINEGYHSSGSQILYNGMTGEQIQSDIYIGPTYYMRLKHMVKDKINYRARGPRTLLTRQTVQGRANDGGLRVGEMERDGIIAHGISHFLQESMMVRGDEYYMAICNKTGTIAIYNSMRNLFISPMADGPIKFTGNLLNEMNIEKITRFGRSFSIVRIPYSFKLLLQELMTMNVTMRIITEDNIDQLDSMSYSNTINKLTFDDNPNTSDIISKVIENSKTNSSRGYIQTKESRKTELSKKQDNANAVMLDNQKAQERMLKDIENLGWRLEQRVLVEGVEEDQPSPNKYKYIFASLILDENGSPTELWDESAEGYDKFPNKHPVGWQEKDLVYSDGIRIPDEVMSNELARNQTPNNWISSIINIYQEYSKVMYKKRLMEEAQRTAEQGNAAEVGVGEASPLGYTLSPEYTASSPPYTASSPGYTASSPIVGMAIPGQQQMSYGMAAAAAAAAANQPSFPTTPLSPEYTASSPSGGSIISNGVQYLSSQQLGGGIVVPSPLIPIKVTPNSNMGGGNILSVNNDSLQNKQDTTNNGGSTKTIHLSQSSLS